MSGDQASPSADMRAGADDHADTAVAGGGI
jgi:hypothetical protein